MLGWRTVQLPDLAVTMSDLLLRQHKPFIAFWLARVFTASGFQMLTVAIGWHLYQLTGSVLDLGLVGLFEFLPRLLFMLHAGHVADRFERRKIAAACQGLLALVALALLGALTGAMAGAMAVPAQRFAAVLTLGVTAAGVPFLGIGAAFWGLLVGIAVYTLEQGVARRG